MAAATPRPSPRPAPPRRGRARRICTPTTIRPSSPARARPAWRSSSRPRKRTRCGGGGRRRARGRCQRRHWCRTGLGRRRTGALRLPARGVPGRRPRRRAHRIGRGIRAGRHRIGDLPFAMLRQRPVELLHVTDGEILAARDRLWEDLRSPYRRGPVRGLAGGPRPRPPPLPGPLRRQRRLARRGRGARRAPGVAGRLRASPRSGPDRAPGRSARASLRAARPPRRGCHRSRGHCLPAGAYRR